jgi:putative FmdB family regulatory protein
MPLYEYVCKSCSKQFEEIVSGDATPHCPACSTASVERVPFSRVAVGKSGGDAGADLPAGCGRCGDPRGPGACAMR